MAKKGQEERQKEARPEGVGGKAEEERSRLAGGGAAGASQADEASRYPRAADQPERQPGVAGTVIERQLERGGELGARVSASGRQARHLSCCISRRKIRACCWTSRQSPVASKVKSESDHGSTWTTRTKKSAICQKAVLRLFVFNCLRVPDRRNRGKYLIANDLWLSM